MIQPLTREGCERTADVAAKVNEVIAVLARQDAQLDFLRREVGRVEALMTGEGQAAKGEEEDTPAIYRMRAEVYRMRAEVAQTRGHLSTVMQREAALRAERDAAQAEVEEHRRHVATLKHAVREARGNLDYGHIWTPNDTQYVRDAIAALRAALGEEASDVE